MLLKDEINLYRPALELERILPRALRSISVMVLFLAALTNLVIVGFFIALASLDAGTLALTIIFGEARLYFAIFLIIFGPLFSVLMLSFFYNTFYFRGIESIVHEGDAKEGGITYEVAYILSEAKNDLTRSFLMSPYGRDVIKRCGIPEDKLLHFLDSKKTALAVEALEIPQAGFLTLEHLAGHIFENDDALSEFLFKYGVSREIYYGAVGWTVRIYHKSKHDERWWSRENLGKVNGIGNGWSYGGAYILERYVRDIKTTTVFSALSSDTVYADEKIEQIETILARAKDANIILVGEYGVGKMDILVRLGQKMKKGETVSAIEGYRLVVFDTESFIAMNGSKAEFEEAFLKMLTQAEAAGNIIIVIENIAKFFSSVEALGSDAADLMDTYLTSSTLHIIATSDPMSFHQHLETKSQLAQRFESIHIENPDLSSTMRVLQDIAVGYEKKNKVVFTYSSIQAIVEGADQYITEGVMPDKAVELLVEVIPAAKHDTVALITKDFVNEYISEKTGIPTGPITKEERDKLLNLEDILHKRIIGQHSAIKVISNAMRRARAGVQTKKRPMGSFLFLGSTGVGKTETAKALAAVFFGDESKMLRIDMSEFSGQGGLSKLIGEGGTSGILPNMLRERPYGVLLLDEFEKASSEVHDLFLQIIDEGIFSDARGRRVSARNTIIIATSNAGSNLIWDIVARRENPTDKRDEIIDTIIHEGIYKPELINRFDGVIIFEPLTLDQREKVAYLMLEELKERIKKKGYELIIDEVLINTLTTKGYNPQFGARPMRRVMQDTIEEKIAEKIIAGSIQQGEKIWFYAEDFKE